MSLDEYNVEQHKEMITLSHPDYVAKSIFKNDSVSYHFVKDAVDENDELKEMVRALKNELQGNFKTQHTWNLIAKAEQLLKESE